ncbi:MAG: hypothetical protein ABIE23_03860 [archaeon]
MPIFRRIKDGAHKLNIWWMAGKANRQADRLLKSEKRLRKKEKNRDAQGPIAPIN